MNSVSVSGAVLSKYLRDEKLTLIPSEWQILEKRPKAYRFYYTYRAAYHGHSYTAYKQIFFPTSQMTEITLSETPSAPSYLAVPPWLWNRREERHFSLKKYKKQKIEKLKNLVAKKKQNENQPT